NTSRRPRREFMRHLWPTYHQHVAFLRERFSRRLAGERKAMSGDAGDLQVWMTTAPHVGNSRRYARFARDAGRSETDDHYSLLTLYFSCAYFSTAQAIELDALRRAIDQCLFQDERDRLLAAWISAAAVAINAPGHTAQYLKPRHEAICSRIKRQWERPIWSL